MPFLGDDVDENVLDRFSIEFLIFQKIFQNRSWSNHSSS